MNVLRRGLDNLMESPRLYGFDPGRRKRGVRPLLLSQPPTILSTLPFLANLDDEKRLRWIERA
jgi:hypothetical protein